jgi:predicted phage tail component-like protein
MSLLGFTFDGTHSSDFDIISKSINRPILAALRRKELTIPGRHGNYNFTGNTYENKIIEVEIKYIGTSFSELRNRARSLAAWLSSTGAYKQLIFDDETDKYYLAKLYSQVSLQNLFRIGQANLTFDCYPFAYSTSESSFSVEITEDDQEFTITNNGTAETPQIITITNTGLTTIAGFTLTRQESS